MLSFDRIIRRSHLYLGLLLMPWLLMYGLSSFIICHEGWFKSTQAPTWQLLFNRPYDRAISDHVDTRDAANKVLEDCGMPGAFWAQRPNPEELHITRVRFLDETSVTYSLKDHRVRAERRPRAWSQVIVALHFRGGFEQPSRWNTVWAILVDVACVAILVWIASGIFMWWRLVRTRLWGALALGSGIASFLLLLGQL
jgi:hypothetical protein